MLQEREGKESKMDRQYIWIVLTCGDFIMVDNDIVSILFFNVIIFFYFIFLAFFLYFRFLICCFGVRIEGLIRLLCICVIERDIGSILL
jgi:hypothetical protein